MPKSFILQILYNYDTKIRILKYVTWLTVKSVHAYNVKDL